MFRDIRWISLYSIEKTEEGKEAGGRGRGDASLGDRERGSSVSYYFFFFFSKAGIVSTRSVSMLNELHLARDYAGGNFREEFESG